MNEPDKIVFNIKEGGAQNYINAYHSVLPGKTEGNTYLYEKGVTKMELNYYTILPDFEILVGEAYSNKTLVGQRTPDDNPDRIHINMVKSGQVSHNFDRQEKTLDSNSSVRVFMYNGQFPMEASIMANIQYQSIAFKFTKNAFARLMPEGKEIINELFPSHRPISYHTYLPPEMESLIEDIFMYKNVDIGRDPLTMARGLEVFALLIKTVKRMINMDELHGLHKEDYQRLMKIRDMLLANFSQKIVVEQIAHDFGISISKLKRDFKTLFDSSVYQYYTQAKMTEAYRRLQTGDYSVMEVAFDLGYDNQSKFSQMFKKTVGINPSEVLTVK